MIRSDKNRRLLLLIETVALICLMLVVILFLAGVIPGSRRGKTAQTGQNGNDQAAQSGDESAKDLGSLSNEGYALEQVVVLSRHNIRSPLSGPDSVLGEITPHKWFEWSSPASELSVRGGVEEAGMGQYFRQWLEQEKLFPENYQPAEDAVRIYANSKQRTIATAQYFTAGLLPTVNEDIEYHAAFDEMDPVFNPQLTFTSDAYDKAAQEQIAEYDDEIKALTDNYDLITDVTDMKESKAYKDGDVKDYRTDDTKVTLETGAEPAMEGSLKLACSVADALVLQYYEEEDPVKAAFGHELNDKQWKDIGEIVGTYTEVLFGTPLIAANVAHPLLQELDAEMSADGRQFTFLCGHDSNVMSVLTALGAEAWKLPATVEKSTPIGCKLVFTKWKAADGAVLWDVDLVYQTTEQLRDVEILTEKDHPAVVDIDLKELKQNKDGLYPEKEMRARFADAIGAYDRIKQEY